MIEGALTIRRESAAPISQNMFNPESSSMFGEAYTITREGSTEDLKHRQTGNVSYPMQLEKNMNTVVNRGIFQAQLAIILEKLTKAAVVEIGKVADECSAALRSEICQHKNDNEALRKKCYLLEIELKASRSTQAQKTVAASRRQSGIQGSDEAFNREMSVAIDGVFGKDWCMNLWRDGKPPQEEPVDPDSLKDVTEAIGLMDNEPELIFVKEEMFEDTPAGQQKGVRVKRNGGASTADSMAEGAVEELHLYQGGVNTFAMPADSQQEEGTPSTSMENPMEDPSLATLVDTAADSVTVEYLDYPDNVNLNTPRNLTNYQRTGKEQKQFDCLFCGKSFSYMSYLKVHIRRHSGEKPFCCTVCGRRFAQKTYLKLHERTHSGEKPYSCVECGKSFSQKSSLNVHLRSHTGEKPYSCVDCGKSYAYKHGFNQHQCFN